MSLVKSITSAKLSNKLIKVILFTLVFINLIYFTSVIHNNNKERISLITSKLTSSTSGNNNKQQEQHLTDADNDKLLSSSNQQQQDAHETVLEEQEKEQQTQQQQSLSDDDIQFKKLVDAKLNSVKKNQGKYYMTNTDLLETKIKVPIKQFLKKYESAESWINKNELYYDPRFTLSIYLNELYMQYQEMSDEQLIDGNDNQHLIGGKINSNELPEISLPFNWVDWIDLTMLNKEFSKPMYQRLKCQDIQANSHSNPDTSYFCTDNEDISEETFQEFFKMGYKYKTQFPGFIINDHERHEHYCDNDYRVMQAKAYTMTHLLNPLKVIILGADKKDGNGGTFEFSVDNSKTRLTSSKLIDRYMESHGYYTRKQDSNIDTVRNGKRFFFDSSEDQNEVPDIIEMDYLSTWNQLNEKVVPKYLSPNETGYTNFLHMRDKNSMVLKESKFMEPPSIASQIEQYTGKPENELSPQEKLYLEGLQECSKYTDENEVRYFRMAVINPGDPRNRENEWGWHYDWRFFNGALNYEKPDWNQQELTHRTNIILDRLLRNWSKFAMEKGIITWIMHGPLLSWYWNGLLFPYDNDIDIQMPIDELVNLAKNYNQTLIVENPSEGYGKYLIEVNTYFHNRGISAEQNHIDARFHDVDSGIYIDITALSSSNAEVPKEYKQEKTIQLIDDLTKTNSNKEGAGNNGKQVNSENQLIFNDRRKHFYKIDQISPLKFSMMQGIPVMVPNGITNRLQFEYSKGLKSLEFDNWFYIKQLNLWVQKDNIIHILEDQTRTSNEDILKQIQPPSSLSNDQILKLLNNEEILQEYYLTRSLTRFHDFEKQVLFDDNGNDKPLDLIKYKTYKKGLKMVKPLRKALYEYENIERIKHHH